MLPELSRSMLKNSLVLGLFAVGTVGTVTVLRDSTAERIQAAERTAQMKVLGELLPADSHDNNLPDSVRTLEHPLLGSPGPHPVYTARLNGRPSAVILQVSAPDGYSGTIQLLVGIRRDGQVAGVRVLQHHETPGLGDKIETAKSAWIRSFDGKSLSDPAPSAWAVRKDGGAFDQFAGATITPRAVVAAVQRALQYFATHQAELLGEPPETTAPTGATRHEEQRP